MATKTGEKTSRQILNGSHQRVTGQRALLLDLIQRNEGHLDADELHRRARQKNRRLSLSTVYRNLQLFKKLGLVEEYHFAKGHHHYEAKPVREHQHLLCLNCGKIVEINVPLMRQFKDEVGRKYGFDVKEAEVHLGGLCSDCASRKTGKKK